MGFLEGMMGNVSEANTADVEQDVEKMLAPGETVQKAYVLIRDLVIFTNKRLVLVDKQGMTGKKVEYHSIPYSKITHFAIETAGTLDTDAELKIWVSGAPMPIQKTFNRKVDIFEVQRVLAAHV